MRVHRRAVSSVADAQVADRPTEVGCAVLVRGRDPIESSDPIPESAASLRPGEHLAAACQDHAIAVAGLDRITRGSPIDNGFRFGRHAVSLTGHASRTQSPVASSSIAHSSVRRRTPGIRAKSPLGGPSFTASGPHASPASCVGDSGPGRRCMPRRRLRRRGRVPVGRYRGGETVRAWPLAMGGDPTPAPNREAPECPTQ